MSEIEKELTEHLSVIPEIVVAFLFGSQAAGKLRADSDVDIGLLFESGYVPSSDELLDIEDRLTRLVKREVDLVVLNQASPILRMQVLQKGKKLFERDRRVYNNFFVRTVNEYDDLKRVRSVIEKNILKGRIYG